MGVEVVMGQLLDGVAPHMADHKDDYTFIVSDEEEKDKTEIIKLLKESGAEVLLNYLPVGSENATKFYAQCALEAGIGIY